MKIISYSDLHLEFGQNFQPPSDSDADVMILAGDIITFRNFKPLGWMLKF
jgi:predicted phosphodiesterase